MVVASSHMNFVVVVYVMISIRPSGWLAKSLMLAVVNVIHIKRLHDGGTH